MAQVYDQGLKEIFSYPAMICEWLKMILPDDWVNDLTPDRCSRHLNNFVTKTMS